MSITQAPALLSERIRQQTWDAHEAAEHTPYLQDLMAGRLGISDYARLLVQYHALYETLEGVVAANTDVTVAPLLAPELARLDALRADLDHLAGTSWTEVPALRATVAYCDRLRELQASWPRGVLAHHYVRYMGDLSGGQIVGRVLRRVLRLDDEHGTEFYRFDAIPSPKAFKTRYRAQLDALPWDATEQQRLIDESVTAFAANTAILLELQPVSSFASFPHDDAEDEAES